MKILILKPSALAALDAKNTTKTNNQLLHPATLKTGESFLNADLLNDCNPGQTWEHYHDLLTSAEVRDITDQDLHKGPQFTKHGIQSEEEFDAAVAQANENT